MRRLSVGEELTVEERQTRAASAIDFTADPAKAAAGYYGRPTSKLKDRKIMRKTIKL